MAAKRPPVTHLTATTRVLRFHFKRPALSIADAHDEVKSLALRLGAGEPTKDDQVLEEKLGKATGLTVADLAQHAKNWPAD